MNSLTRIFIAEQDCESLVNTMLWLEQYPDFEVYGTDFGGASLNEQIEEVQPDVVMLGMTSNAQAALSIKGIRSTSIEPAVLLVTRTDSADSLLSECDGSIGPKTALKEVPELIRKAINRRKLAAMAVAPLPMAKAG